MIIGSCYVNIHIYSSQSLKEKRAILRSVFDQARHKFNISIAEIGSQNLWQRSEIGFTCVTNEVNQAQKIMDQVINFLYSFHEFEMIDIQQEIL